jgi:hypothetical protein
MGDTLGGLKPESVIWNSYLAALGTDVHEKAGTGEPVLVVVGVGMASTAYPGAAAIMASAARPAVTSAKRR